MPVDKPGSGPNAGRPAVFDQEVVGDPSGDIGPVKKVVLPNKTPEQTGDIKLSAALPDRAVQLLSNNAVDSSIAAFQDSFRHAVGRLNQAYSSLMLMQQVQFNNGLIGVPGIFYQPPSGEAIWVNASGDNLPYQPQKQLRDHHNLFLQQAGLAVNSLCQQLAHYQFQVRENVCQLASLGIQAQMPLLQLQQLLPSPTLQLQPIALHHFSGIYTCPPDVGFSQPWLPAGCSFSYGSGRLQGFPSPESHWLPGHELQSAMPVTPGFYYLPQPPSPGRVFQSPMDPYASWNQWLASKAYDGQLPDLYPGLYYPEHAIEKSEVSMSSVGQDQRRFSQSESAGREPNTFRENVTSAPEVIEQLQQTVVEKEGNIAILQKLLSDAHKKASEAVKQHKSGEKADREIENLRTQLRIEKAKHNTELDRLMLLQKKALSEKEDEILLLKDKLPLLERENTRSQKSIDTLEKKLKDAEADHKEKLEGLIDSQSKSKAQTEAEINELKKALAIAQQVVENNSESGVGEDVLVYQQKIESLTQQIERAGQKYQQDVDDLKHNQECLLRERNEEIKVLKEELEQVEKKSKESVSLGDEQRMAKLSDDLIVAVAARERLQADIKRIEKRTHEREIDLKDQLKQKQKENSELLAQYKKLEADERNQQVVVLQKEERIAKLQKQLGEVEKNVSGTERSHQQIENLKKQLQQEKFDHQAELDHLLQLQKSVLSEKENDLLALRQELQSMEEMLEKLPLLESENARAKNNVEELNKRLKDTEIAYHEKLDDLVESQIKGKLHAEAEISRLQQALTDTEQAVEKKYGKQDEKKVLAYKERIEGLTQQIERNEKKYEQIIAELKRNQDDLLRGKNKEIEAIKVELESLKKQANESLDDKQRIATLSDNFRDAAAARDRLQADIENIKKKSREKEIDFEKQLDKKQRENNELLAQYQKLTSELPKVRQLREQAEEKSKKLQRQLQLIKLDIREEDQERETRIIHLQSQLDDYKIKESSWGREKGQLDDLKNELSRKLDEISKLENSLSALQADNSKMQEGHKQDIKVLKSEWQKEIANITSECEKLNQNYRVMQQSKDRVERELTDLKRESKKKENEWSDKVLALRTENSQLVSNIEDVKQRLCTLHREQQEKNSVEEDASKRVVKLQSQLQGLTTSHEIKVEEMKKAHQLEMDHLGYVPLNG